MKKNSKSVKKFIRAQKALIRRQFFDVKKQNEMIKGLYSKLLEKPEHLVEKIKEVKKEDKKPKVKSKKA
ncbi:MAG: hypothetical protein AAB509_02110 [Patescibacteria group bacterium]